MKPQLKYGLITAIVIFAIDIVLSMNGLRGTPAAKGLGWIEYVIMAAAIVLALRDTRTQSAGFLNYGRGLGVGTVMSLWTGLFTAILSYPYYKFINHGFIDFINQQVDDQMENKLGTGSQAQMEMASKWAHMMTSPGGVSILKFFSVFVMGFILSLIIAAIMKKDNPNPDTQANYMS
jgi:glycerol uptake facilitator-like aquaporin